MDLLRRNNHFRTLFIAQIVSYCGDWFATVALLGIVHDYTHSALLVALVWVFQSLPAFIVSPWAGPVADRFDRRKIMVGVSAAQAMAALGYLLVHSRSTVAFGLVAETLVATLAAFFGPASQAAMPNIVEPQDLGTANAMMGSTWGAMLAIGAALGGVFTHFAGRSAAFLADAVSFAIAGLLIATVRVPMTERIGPPKGKMRPFHDSREALKFARKRPQILALLASKFAFGMGAGAVALLPVLARKKFHGGDGITALFLSARGTAVLLSPFLIKRWVGSSIPKIIRICGFATTIYGAMYFGVATVPAVGLAVVFVFMAHCGGGWQWTYSTMGLQLATPDQLRGRIFAADFALVTLTMSISSTAAGLLAGRFGPGPVMAGLATTSLLIGGAYFWFTRHLTATVVTQASSNADAL